MKTPTSCFLDKVFYVKGTVMLFFKSIQVEFAILDRIDNPHIMSNSLWGKHTPTHTPLHLFTNNCGPIKFCMYFTDNRGLTNTDTHN